MQNVIVFHGRVVGKKKLVKDHAISGITGLNDFEFVPAGILARKQSGIGTGHLFRMKPTRYEGKFEGHIVKPGGETVAIGPEMTQEDCLPVKRGVIPFRVPGREVPSQSVNEDDCCDQVNKY